MTRRTQVMAGLGILAVALLGGITWFLTRVDEDMLRYGPPLHARDLGHLPPSTRLARAQMDLERRHMHQLSLPLEARPLLTMYRLEPMVSATTLLSQDPKVKDDLRDLAEAYAAIGLKDQAHFIRRAGDGRSTDAKSLNNQWMTLLESPHHDAGTLTYLDTHAKDLWP